MTEPNAAFRPSGSIEFEALDPVAVAQQLKQPKQDDTTDHDPLSINFGRDKETRATQAERMLSGAAIDWFVSLPAEARPKALCERYPHVANRIASAWSNHARAGEALALLLADARWGTAGFPGQVQAELQALQSQLAR
jgi:hypothetical protein